MIKKILNLTIIFFFLVTASGPICPIARSAEGEVVLPVPGTMVGLSPAYQPVIIKGLTVHKDNPFLFDFIVDAGQDKMSGGPLKKEGEKLIKYFLASLAIPDKDVWVNLSPYERNRMVPEALGQTDMGRDLLEQDYILKQITASLIYPEKELGKIFWDKVYAKAQAMYGTTQVPINTFNKVWIMADRAEVFEHNQTAYVVDSHLKVMLEEDYLALKKHQRQLELTPTRGHVDEGNVSPIVREIILPQLEKEINTGKNFANLRQIFNSIILASWYKKNLKQALLNQVYADKSKVDGVKRSNRVDQQDLSPEKIYEQYLKAYKKGVFNYIKEDTNAANGETLPRKYFSGGFAIAGTPAADPGRTTDPRVFDAAMESQVGGKHEMLFFVFMESGKEHNGHEIANSKMAKVIGMVKGVVDDFLANPVDIKKLRARLDDRRDIFSVVSVRDGIKEVKGKDPLIVEAGKEVIRTTHSLKELYGLEDDPGRMTFTVTLQVGNKREVGVNEITFFAVVPRGTAEDVARKAFLEAVRDLRIKENRLQEIINSARHGDEGQAARSLERSRRRVDQRASILMALGGSLTEIERISRRGATDIYPMALTAIPLWAGHKVRSIKIISKDAQESIAPLGVSSALWGDFIEEYPNLPPWELIRLSAAVQGYSIGIENIEDKGTLEYLDEMAIGHNHVVTFTSHDGKSLYVRSLKGTSARVFDSRGKIGEFDAENVDAETRSITVGFLRIIVGRDHVVHVENAAVQPVTYFSHSSAERPIEESKSNPAMIHVGLNVGPALAHAARLYFNALVPKVHHPIEMTLTNIATKSDRTALREAFVEEILKDGRPKTLEEALGKVLELRLVYGMSAEMSNVEVEFLKEVFRKQEEKDLAMTGTLNDFDDVTMKDNEKGIFKISGHGDITVISSLDNEGNMSVRILDNGTLFKILSSNVRDVETNGLYIRVINEGINVLKTLGEGAQSGEGVPFGIFTMPSLTPKEELARELREIGRLNRNSGTRNGGPDVKARFYEMAAKLEEANPKKIPDDLSRFNLHTFLGPLYGAYVVGKGALSNAKRGKASVAKGAENQFLKDAAMKIAADKAALAPGGIDLNTTNGMQWMDSKDGQGVEMDIDPAMNRDIITRIRREGVDNLRPVILQMTPVTSVWSLMGLRAPARATTSV